MNGSLCIKTPKSQVHFFVEASNDKRLIGFFFEVHELITLLPNIRHFQEGYKCNYPYVSLGMFTVSKH
jgi:hypothetical protein